MQNGFEERSCRQQDGFGMAAATASSTTDQAVHPWEFRTMPSTNQTMQRLPRPLFGDACRIAAYALAVLALWTNNVMTANAADRLEQDFAASDLSAEPYSVFVVQAGSHTRCGPGADFYRTDELRRGQQLDVYLETGDGWLGVRPPEESFSWIPADDIELDASGTSGSVIQDRSVVWIGTHLGRARKYRWQIQLPVGEPVTILGRSEREGPEGPKKWYRIVPPSGEFRWIHRSEVAESAEELIASVTKADPRNQPTPAINPDVQSIPSETSGQSILDRVASHVKNRISPPKDPSYAESPDLVPRRQTRTSNPLSPVVQTPSLGRIADANASSGDGFQAAGQSAALSRATLSPSQSPSMNNPIGSGLPSHVASTESALNANALGPVTTTNHSPASASYGASEAVILGQPRLVETNAAPRGSEVASDSNWVTVNRDRPANVQQATHLQPIKTHDLAAALRGVSTTMDNVADHHGRSGTAGRYVDPQRIEAVRDEARTADLARLQLVFSRLIAASASEAEIEPIERAAQDLASRATDELVRSRAGVLVERAQQYRRIARRRDGQSIISTSQPPRIPNRNTTIPSSIRAASATLPSESAVTPPGEAKNDGWITGKLVQVYSVRDRHPPYALTDNTGRTIAYVTPNPGLNLRSHLNSEVRVNGKHGFLSGMKTPHVLVTNAVRVAGGF